MEISICAAAAAAAAVTWLFSNILLATIFFVG